MSTSHNSSVPEAVPASSGGKVLINVAAAVIVIFGLSRISGIVGPVFLALVLTICIYPIKQRLINRGSRRCLPVIARICSADHRTE